jgi:hypothetical protein
MLESMGIDALLLMKKIDGQYNELSCSHMAPLDADIHEF